jgi:hypothetical protein
MIKGNIIIGNNLLANQLIKHFPVFILFHAPVAATPTTTNQEKSKSSNKSRKKLYDQQQKYTKSSKRQSEGDKQKFIFYIF